MPATSGYPHTQIDILIVEDSPTQAEKLRLLLDTHGYRTHIATDGRTALEAVRTRQPRLVLSDIMMPEMDGYALCSAIKNDPASHGIPVILLTSLIDPRDIVRGLESGADNFIRKPYVDAYLLTRIEHVLMNQQLRRNQNFEIGIALFLGGQKHFINAERQQILDLLISTYEQAVIVNEELAARERQVNELNVRLSRHAAQLEATSKEIARQNMELEQANRMKSEFLANMSHELRTPLNAIIGFSEAMMHGLTGDLSAPQREYINDIFEGGTHLLSLINDILDLSKIEAGKMTLELEQTDLRALLESSLGMLKEKASAGRIVLRAEIEDVGAVQTDRRKTRQIVYNLLSNAVKFTPEGGTVALRMRRIAREDIVADSDFRAGEPDPRYRDFVEIRVADTGIGIGHDDLQRLFKPFVQLDSSLSRKFEGTGLGLALVLQLVVLHGGMLAVNSERGRGSEFLVWLPCRHEAQEHAAADAVRLGAGE
jgi:signal transduction histidine kinase